MMGYRDKYMNFLRTNEIEIVNLIQIMQSEHTEIYISVHAYSDLYKIFECMFSDSDDRHT